MSATGEFYHTPCLIFFKIMIFKLLAMSDNFIDLSLCCVVSFYNYLKLCSYSQINTCLSNQILLKGLPSDSYSTF
ncbi:hypothetical protein HRM2_28380 [Desulforapulum autotrophicum HRM2]|uniref:Uncharacterized protein n=1 Tax=Desulforapulum autotrophicum (strain ATCC 43914 / DSM 3382 / VKM B-1955 / HRM2) TaxID=177437 RepID=C0QJB3_DESAH|nr:hypothetical protein HRM2_28380 [Desulforapulum autotrophicum HRM2]